MLIRPARIGDSSEIARLFGQLGYPANLGDMHERLGRLLPNPNHRVLVAATDPALQGFVCLERRLILGSGDKFELVGLVVDQDCRRTGIGRQLVAAGEDWVRSLGGHDIFLRSNIVRPEAHQFYPAQGYQLEKTQHTYRKAV